jgi:transcriptional regulator
VHEQDRAEPWGVGDAPRPYIDALLRGFIGVTLTAERVEAKRKLSQNKSGADFDGVARGLAASGDPMSEDLVARMRETRAVSDKPDGN